MNQLTTEGRALLGFMDEQDAVTFLRQMCASDTRSDADLRAAWRAARTAAEGLSPVDLQADFKPIPEKHAAHLDAVAASPLIPETVGRQKWSLALVEIDKLVCFQKFVDVGHAHEIRAERDAKDLAHALDICIPHKKIPRNVAVQMDPRDNTYTVFAPGYDFRIIGPAQHEDPVTKRRTLGFAVGWGVPFVQVARYQGRYILKNGYHRAYLLRQAGVTHIPCLLLDAENISDIGANRPGFFSEALMMAARPPVFGDFFSDAVSSGIELRARTKLIRIRAEEIPLPAAVSLPTPKAQDPATPQPERTPPTAGSPFEEFDVEHEGWNVYDLADGTRLKLRQHLLRLEPAPGGAGFQMKFSQAIMAIQPPKSLRSAPSAQLAAPAELEAAVVARNLAFKPVSIPANEYLTSTGFRLRVRLELASVSRTRLHDADGDPIYIVNSQANLDVVPPGGG